MSELMSLSARLASETPVVGCKINPVFRLVFQGSFSEVPPDSLLCTWYRDQIPCSVHDSEVANVQCLYCLKLKILVNDSYHCSTNCFQDAWPRHLESHRQAAEAFHQIIVGDDDDQPWPDFLSSSLFDKSGGDGRKWLKLCSTDTYVPSTADTGFRLKLESAYMDGSTGSLLRNTLLTNPVMSFLTPWPRCLIKLRSSLESWMINSPEVRTSKDMKFRVLSYNILSDVSASTSKYSYCPSWALTWEYRQKNLLREIIGYDADIICLQEVQSNHLENFFEPELARHGYSAMYKKKTDEVYTKQNTGDGCATFYRSHRFKEVWRYELEFSKTVLSLVETLDPALRPEGRIRLIKPNVALVAILEALNTGCSVDGFGSRICVANTHIFANPEFPDVKLCQVFYLVHELEKICSSHIPLLICGDFNSLPGTDPHRFVVRGKVDSSSTMEGPDPLGVYQLLKLHHSLPLASAYASFLSSEWIEEEHLGKMDRENCEPKFTIFRPKFSNLPKLTISRRTFAKALDYIFYTENSLRVEGLLELLSRESVGLGLPSPLWSSDHIALMASFSLKLISMPTSASLEPTAASCKYY